MSHTLICSAMNIRSVFAAMVVVENFSSVIIISNVNSLKLPGGQGYILIPTQNPKNQRI
jgi:hypothetical protein